MKQKTRSISPQRARYLKDMRQIHALQRQAGIEDPEYRALLTSRYGVNSSSRITPDQRRDFIRYLNQRAGGGGQGFPGRPSLMEDPKKGPMLGKIEAFLAEAKRPWSYVHAMAQRMYRVDRVEWCTKHQLRHIIGELAEDARRHGRRT
ncbi:MAG: DUF1018 domain-containing protein [Magnetococcales bacterium]|nr:DUF1018 domain-containing protein [Magnetococcales bacterium]